MVLLFALGGCAEDAISEPSTSPPVTVAASPTTTSAAPMTTSAPTTTTLAPTTTTSPAALSARVYRLVSASIAFVDTPVASGSGVLIEGGYVVTNHHVVWPFEEVRVVFPGGEEFQDVPVADYDSLRDLALLGPMDTSVQPLKLEDGEGMSPGEDLWLVGYPGETESNPKPTMTRGILSRFREWEGGGLTLLQTDAEIGAGQSGGALVDSSGGVVGISTFALADFGLATSAKDLVPIVEEMTRPDQHPTYRLIMPETGKTEFEVELTHLWDVRVYAVDAAAGTVVEIELEGAGDGMFSLSGPVGVLIAADDGETGVETAEVELPTDGRYFLQVELASGGPADFTLRSSVELRPVIDSEDSLELRMEETIIGNIDYHTDADWFRIQLEEGETVTISTDSLGSDTVLFIYSPEAGEDGLAVDDDSGGGVFGFNAELVYEAPHTGEFLVIVENAGNADFGGYYLSAKAPEPIEE